MPPNGWQTASARHKTLDETMQWALAFGPIRRPETHWAPVLAVGRSPPIRPGPLGHLFLLHTLNASCSPTRICYREQDIVVSRYALKRSRALARAPSKNAMAFIRDGRFRAQGRTQRPHRRCAKNRPAGRQPPGGAVYHSPVPRSDQVVKE